MSKAKNIDELAAPSDARARSDSGASVAAAEWQDIREMAEWDRNPRKRTDADIREAMGALRRWGWCAPMVGWSSRKMLVAGHARRLALLRILKQDPALDGKGGVNGELAEKNRRLRESLAGPSMFHVPMRMREFSSLAEAEAYALRDNRAIGADSDEEVGAILRELAEGGTDIDGLGYTEEQLNSLFGDVVPEANGKAKDQSHKMKDEYLVLVECESEEHQIEIIEMMQEQGLTVRAMV